MDMWIIDFGTNMPVEEASSMKRRLNHQARSHADASREPARGIRVSMVAPRRGRGQE